jgi:putative ABC transport system permease protein
MFCETLRDDLRFGVRTLSRNAAFTVAAILTLALGIGANTAIFSIIDEALLRPLPVPRPQQIVALYSYDRKRSQYLSSSYPDYLTFAGHAKSFQTLSAYVRFPLNLTIGQHTAHLPVEAVTPNYFSMLDLAPLAGRVFAENARDSDGSQDALISEDLWRSRFHSDRSVIGRTLLIENQPFKIIGIIPERYRGANLNWSDPPQIWIPLSATDLVLPHFKELGVLRSRSMRFLLMLGRLEPGIGIRQAQAELRVLAADLSAAEPATNRDITALAFPASNSKFWPAYRSSITHTVSVFGGAAGLILLLACTNVSNLLLGRAISRRREISIRIAMGAPRGRLIHQLLTENFLLAASSFLLALPVTWGLQKVLLQFPTALGLPLALHLDVENRVFFFCLLLSFATTVMFGLASALQATKPDILPVLKESGSQAAVSGGFWLRSALIVVQVAFSLILLVAGGLFARSLLKAYATDTGFRSSGLLLASFDLTGERYTAERRNSFLQHTLEEISALPSVESGTVALDAPLAGIQAAAKVIIRETKAQMLIDHNIVGPNFLHTLGIELIRGRDFVARDDANAPRVAIVNETMAKRLWPGGDPTGQIFLISGDAGAETAYTVIGVARDSKYKSLWEQTEPYFYLAAYQSSLPVSTLMVRSRAPQNNFVLALRKQWDVLAPRVPLFGILTGEQLVNVSLAPQRLAALMLFSFSGLALVLAAVGLYSVTAHSVAQRTREIGVRISVGARPAEVIAHIMGPTLRLVVMGVLFGLAVSLVLMRFAAASANGVSPQDALTYAAVILLLIAVSSAAVVAPALHAARIDPVVALKWE